MKKTLLLTLLMPLFFYAEASDTLTLRQIYNFDVSDTFHYRLRQGVIDSSSIHYVYTDWTDVIVGKSVSANNDTIDYIINHSWGQTDTTIITRLDSNIITGIDTPADQGCMATFSIDTSSGMLTNTMRWGCDFSEANNIYAQGLGDILNYRDADDNMGGTTIYLVSYTKAGVTDTTVYVSVGLKDPDDKEISIRLFPNPASYLLHLLFPDIHYNSQFILTDLLGQRVYSSTITDSETTHDISHLTSGLYTWRIISDNTILKTGKIIKQ